MAFLKWKYLLWFYYSIFYFFVIEWLSTTLLPVPSRPVQMKGEVRGERERIAVLYHSVKFRWSIRVKYYMKSYYVILYHPIRYYIVSHHIVAIIILHDGQLDNLYRTSFPVLSKLQLSYILKMRCSYRDRKRKMQNSSCNCSKLIYSIIDVTEDK